MMTIYTFAEARYDENDALGVTIHVADHCAGPRYCLWSEGMRKQLIQAAHDVIDLPTSEHCYVQEARAVLAYLQLQQSKKGERL